MELKSFFVQDAEGNIVANSTVTVYEDDGVTVAAIYDEAGAPKANPFSAGSNGWASFRAATGSYEAYAIIDDLGNTVPIYLTFMSPEEFDPAGAADAAYKAARQRENQTGTQTANTISDLSQAISIAVREITESSYSLFNIESFGAVGDGETNNTSAFLAANATLSNFGGEIYIPDGVFITDIGLRLPDNCGLSGNGWSRSVIRLSDTADLSESVVTNSNNTGGIDNTTPNRNILVKNVQLDANVQRFSVESGTSNVAAQAIPAHGSVSLNISMPGVTTGGRVDGRYSWVSDFLSVRAESVSNGAVRVKLINNSDVPLDIPAGTITARRYEYSGFAGFTVGCAIGFAGVQDSIIYGVYGCNAPKHSCDISAAVFDLGDSGGDTEAGYPPNPSRNIKVINSRWSHGGDDNWTSHGCEYVWVINNFSFDAQGTYIKGNTNNYEIDDSSRHVWLSNCYGVNGTNGVEVKGHQTHPAASSVVIDGCRFDHSISAGIDLHHTSHGDSGQDPSTTGAHVRISKSYTRYCDNQHIRVLSYRNVTIDGLTCIDDGRTTSSKPIAIENGANSVHAHRIHAEGFHNVSNVLFIASGTTSDVHVHDSYFHGGTINGVQVGASVKRWSLNNCHFVAGDNLAGTNQAITSGSFLSSWNGRLNKVTQEGFSRWCVQGGSEIPETDFIVGGGSAQLSGNLNIGNGNYDTAIETASTAGWRYNQSSYLMGTRGNGSPLLLHRTGSDGEILSFYRSNNKIAGIDVSGSSVVYNTSSDATLKDVHGKYSAEDGLATINAIQLHDYTWKSDGKAGRGPLAQELYEVYPDAVSPGGYTAGESGEKCEADNPAAVYSPWGVDYSKLVVPLLAAVQALTKRVQDLESKE